jgi:hypothetical protein
MKIRLLEQYKNQNNWKGMYCCLVNSEINPQDYLKSVHKMLEVEKESDEVEVEENDQESPCIYGFSVHKRNPVNM